MAGVFNLEAKAKIAAMAVSPARSAAFEILFRVERESSYASELLHSPAYHRLSTRDHGLATELVLGALRWRSRLDEELTGASSQQFDRLDLEIVIALRLALYQLRCLNRIPRRAALYESVELVKLARKRSAASFVNAVLRKLAGQNRPYALSFQGDISSSTGSIARELAHPLWLVERWAKEYGLPAAQKICRYDQSTPQTVIRLRSQSVAGKLEQEGITLTPAQLLSSARVVSGDVTKTYVFRDRQIVIQDQASQLVAEMVGNSAGDVASRTSLRMLDCCAAPGGKTLAMADSNPTAVITAVELHPHRARLMRNLLRKGGMQDQIHVIVGNAERLPLNAKFDRVLADVPCSGTGTLARNPEIKWRLQLKDLNDLHARQVAILQSAMGQVRTGGRIVYSTCSLEREENEDVVEEVLAHNKAFRAVDCQTELDRLKKSGDLTWPDVTSRPSGPHLRTLPGVHPCDGFFAAILEKL
jgi:16S rRNA (cytosine967-C5)-methyltransferase